MTCTGSPLRDPGCAFIRDHGLNARIATAGPRAGQATLFDFDDGGFGYLAYDLAVHLWAQASFERRQYAMRHAF